MPNIKNAINELHEMDELWQQQSVVRRLHPLTKVVLTVTFILMTLSFDKYNLTGLIPMGLFPVFVLTVSGITVRKCIKKMRMALPLVCAVGLFNPIFDTEKIMYFMSIPVSGGVISMTTLMLKGIFCVMAAFSLIATTSIYEICGTLRGLHIPNIFVTLFLLTFRYLEVMMEEVDIMSTAYYLRAPKQKGIHISAWGSFTGQLLLRSIDKASEIYTSMSLRANKAEFQYGEIKQIDVGNIAICMGMVATMVLVRLFNVSILIGQIFA